MCGFETRLQFFLFLLLSSPILFIGIYTALLMNAAFNNIISQL